MANFKKIEGLSDEQCKIYQRAIKRGFFRNYDQTWRSKSFANAFIWKYKNRFTAIDMLEDICGHVPTWDDITDMNLMILADNMDEALAASSVKTEMARVNAVIADYEQWIKIPSKNHNRICSRKGDISQSVYLNIEELKLILRYQCKNIKELAVKRIFLIESFVGARWNDAQNIDDRNYDENTNTIHYYSTKNRCDITVPCHAAIRDYITKDESIAFIGPLRLSQYNTTIREICRAVGINKHVVLHRRGEDAEGEKWEFVSSHTGRRSFATNLYIKGISVDTICQLMGHSSPTITMSYIKDKRPLEGSILDAFKDFGY